MLKKLFKSKDCCLAFTNSEFEFLRLILVIVYESNHGAVNGFYQTFFPIATGVCGISVIKVKVFRTIIFFGADDFVPTVSLVGVSIV